MFSLVCLDACVRVRVRVCLCIIGKCIALLILSLGFCSGKLQSVGRRRPALVWGLPAPGQLGLPWDHHRPSRWGRRGCERMHVSGVHSGPPQRAQRQHCWTPVTPHSGFVFLPVHPFLPQLSCSAPSVCAGLSFRRFEFTGYRCTSLGDCVFCSSYKMKVDVGIYMGPSWTEPKLCRLLSSFSLFGTSKGNQCNYGTSIVSEIWNSEVHFPQHLEEDNYLHKGHSCI